VSNFYYQGAGQFAGRFLFFLFFVYAARVLGVSEFGIFSFSLNICYLVYTIMGFGLEHLAVKWVARRRYEKFCTISAANAGTTLAGLILILIIALFFEDSTRYTLMLLGVGFCFFSFNTVIFSYFRGIEAMGVESFFLVGQRLLLLITSAVWLIFYKSAVVLSMAFTFSLCVTFLFLLRQIAGKQVFWLQRPKMAFQKAKVVSVLKEALPLAFVSGLGIIYYRIDSIMIAGYLNMDHVGIYHGAYMVIEGVMLPVRVVMAATFSRLSQYGSMPDLTAYRFYKKLIFLLFCLSLLICAVMYFIAPPVFDLFLGRQYQNSLPVFYVLLLSVIALYPGTMVTQTLIAIDQQKVYMVIAVVCTAANVVLNLLLIPKYGITGAAWATVFSDLMLTGGCIGFVFLFFRKKAA
jgi:O-antigen/teichoic acid export membrane protein